jgi:hypothetical protein
MTMLFHVRCASVSPIPAIDEWRFRHYQARINLHRGSALSNWSIVFWKCDDCFFAITPWRVKQENHVSCDTGTATIKLIAPTLPCPYKEVTDIKRRANAASKR